MDVNQIVNSQPFYNAGDLPLNHRDSPLFSYDVLSIIQGFCAPKDARNLAIALDGMRPEETTARLIHRVNIGIEPFSKLLTLTPSPEGGDQARWEDSVRRLSATDFTGTDEEFLGLLKRFPAIHVLNLPDNFNSSLERLPNGHLNYLKTLKMGWDYNQALPKELVNLQQVTMGDAYHQALPKELVNLQQVTMGRSYHQALPKELVNLQQVTMRDAYNQALPKELVKLQQVTMGWDYSQALPKELVNLQQVTMGWSYRQALPKELVNLQQLTMGGTYNQALPKELVNLQQVTMGWSYNQALPKELVKLQQVTMGDAYNQALPKELVKLQQVTMGRDYNQALPKELLDYLVPQGGSADIWVRTPSPLEATLAAPGGGLNGL